MKSKNETTPSELFTTSGMWYGRNVTVVNMQNKTLGFALYYNNYPVVQYTEVPIDSSACPSEY